MRVAQHQLKKLNNKKGFTLAEVLIVLAITAILFAIGMVAVVNYAKDLKRVEMDNAAREIFTSAQNHLSEMNASGRLKSYVNKHKDETTNSINEGIGVKADYIPSDMPEGWLANEESYKDEYRYLVYTPHKDAGLGHEAVAGSDIDASLIGSMLPTGAIDDTVRTDGSYIIEYSPKSGMIYGVFYMEDKYNVLSAGDLTGNDTLLNDGERADTSDGRKARRDYVKGVIGYYGGAMAFTLGDMQDQGLKMKFDNGDILKAIITDRNYTDDNKTKLTLIIEGRESKSRIEFTLNLDTDATGKVTANTTEANIKRRKGPDGKLTTSTKAAYNIMKYWSVSEEEETVDGKKSTYLKYTINLDDITKEDGHFTDIFNDRAKTGVNDQIFIPGENIVGYVKSESDSGQKIQTVAVSTNSLFNKVIVSNSDDDRYNNHFAGSKPPYRATAYVSSARHLENVDQQISGIYRSDQAASLQKTTITDIIQTKDIDWKDFITEKNADGEVIAGADLKKIYPYATFGNSDKTKFYKTTGSASGSASDSARNGNYMPISRRDLFSFTGASLDDGVVKHQYELKNFNIDNQLNISGDMTSDAGIFRGIALEHKLTFTHIIIRDLTIENAHNAGALCGTVFSSQIPAEDYDRRLEISDVQIINAKIKAQKDVGALCGYVNPNSATGDGKINNVLVKNCDIESSGSSAAGLIGTARYNSGNKMLTISNCTSQVNSCKNTSTSNDTAAAGLVGKVIYPITIENSYSGGKVEHDEINYSDTEPNIDGKCAGGLIGYSDKAVIINNCYSTCSVNGSSAAGGLVGKAVTNNVTFASSYFAGKVIGENNNNRGSIMGISNSKYVFNSNCEYITEVSDSSIKAMGDKTSDPDRVRAKDSDELEVAAGSPNAVASTFPVNLKSTSKYPFRGVNKVSEVTVTAGTVTGSDPYVHYGDWPKSSGEEPEINDAGINGKVMLAYRENIGGKYYWKAWSLDESGNATEKINNLIYKSNRYAQDGVYGILITSDPNEKLINTTTWEIEANVTTGGPTAINKSFAIEEDNKDKPYVFKLGNSDTDTGSYYFFKYVPGEKTDFSLTGKYNNLSFDFEPDFANTTTVNGKFLDGDGNGTKDNPYEVRTLQQLKNVKDNLNKNFKQTLDIKMTEEEHSALVYEEGKGAKNLQGVYDGNNHSVILNETLSNGVSSGIFENISADGGVVKNLKVTGKIAVSGSITNVGGIASRNNGNIENCESTVDITCTSDSNKNIGLIVGTSEKTSNIKNCSSEGTIDLSGIQTLSKKFNIGGIAGKFGTGTMSDTSGTPTIKIKNLPEGSYAGGLIGFKDEPLTVTNSYGFPNYTDALGKLTIGNQTETMGTQMDAIMETFKTVATSDVDSAATTVLKDAIVEDLKRKSIDLAALGAPVWKYEKTNQFFFWTTFDIDNMNVGDPIYVLRKNGKTGTFTVWNSTVKKHSSGKFNVIGPTSSLAGGCIGTTAKDQTYENAQKWYDELISKL